MKDCSRYLENLLDIVGDGIESGDGVILQGFGSFSRWEQTARLGRNPRTGEDVPILPRSSVKFKPGKYLLQKLNAEAEPAK